MIAEAITAAFLLGIGYIAASVFYPMLTGGAAYTPTPRKEAAKALELVDLKRDEVFIDLGCGTGEALIEASKRCDHVRGVEIEPLRWFIAKLRARKARVILGNLFKQDISDADVVFIYQYEGDINDRIAAKIKAETRSGTRVVSYEHEMRSMSLIKSQGDIYIYET